jgi:ATP-dependent helicase/nuclease subunit B
MGKTTYCLSQIQQELIARPQGPSLILLVPEQGTFQMEAALASLPGLGGTMRARVCSFRRLAWTVLQEAGGASRPHLREIGKRMVLQGLLEQNRDRLKVFHQAARHPNFSDHLASAIAELKRYCLTPDRLTEMAEVFPAGANNLLRDKLTDLALLYAELEKFLKNRFTDPDDYLSLLAQVLPNSASLRGGQVWVDGFSGFTPQEYQVLASLLTISERVRVALCLDPAVLADPVKEAELFYQTHITYTDLLGLAREVGAAVEEPVFLPGTEIVGSDTEPVGRGSDQAPNSAKPEPGNPGDTAQAPGNLEQVSDVSEQTRGTSEPVPSDPKQDPDSLEPASVAPAQSNASPRHRFSQNPTLAHLEQAFFCWPRRPYSAEPAQIKLVAAHNRQAEVEWVAREIVDLARDRNCRWREISVLVRDLNLYEELLEQVFADYAIPVFIDYKRPIRHHPLVELLRSALETVNTGWASAPVFRYLKTDFVPITREEVDRLENYCLAHGIKGKRWIDGQPWTYRRRGGLSERDTELSPAQTAAQAAELNELEEINRSREQAIHDLAEFSRAVEANNSFREISTALYNLINRLGVKEKLEEWAREAQANRQLIRAREHAQIYNQVLNLLDEMVEAMGDQTTSVEGYLKVLETGLENLRLGLIPPGLDQVFVGSLDRSRHSEVRANFILGVNDGVLPARPAGDGMLTNHEREQLAVRGLKLAPDAKRSLFDEQYLIYLGLTRATEHLGISYALADQQGNALNPSLLIKELQEILPGIKVQEAPLEPNGHAADLDFMVSPRRALTYLTLKLREAKAGIPLNDGWRDVYNALIPASGQPSAGQLSAGCPSPGELSAECFLTEQSPAGEPSAEQTLFECPPKGLTDVLPGLNRVNGLPVSLAGLFYQNREDSLQPKTRQKLYGTKLRAGVTQIEQFQACPFAHFLKYGLRLKERETWQLKPLDLGRFFHAALKIFVERVEQGQVKDQKLISQRQIQDQGLIGQDQDRVPVQEQNKIQGPDHGPKPESIWSQISEETCNRLVQKIIEELLPELQNELLLSSKRAQYIGQKLLQVVQRSAWAIVEQLRCGSFRPLGLEVGFGFPQELPGLQIPLGDIDVSVPPGEQLPDAALEMVGRIDRLDWAKTEDAGTYLRVLDYKSGSTGLNLNEVYYGLQLQLLTYLEVALRHAGRLTGETAQPGGMLYFRIQNPVLSTKGRLSADEIHRELRKRFRLKGLVLNDLNLLNLMETGLAGDSLILPVGRLKAGGLNSRSAVADREQFAYLRQHLRQTLRDLGRKILAGTVDIKPYLLKKQRACTYCQLKPVCQFDLTAGNEYRVLKALDKPVLWHMLRKEAQGDESKSKSVSNQVDPQPE